MESAFGVEADFRALGAARVEAVREARTPEEWRRLNRVPHAGFPFEWGTCWKGTIQYQVDDFPAEVGFFIDGLGFETNAFGPEFCMLTPPDRAFSFSVVPTPEGGRATPADAVRIGFMLKDVRASAAELRRRGIRFTREPAPHAEGGPLWRGEFATPNGIPVEIWGLVAEADPA